MDDIERRRPRRLWPALKSIYDQLPLGRRRQFYVTTVLLLVGGLAELATIGAVFPFLAVISPLGSNGHLAPLVHMVQVIARSTGLGVVAAAAILLVGIAAFSSALRLLLAHMSYKVVFGSAHDIGLQTYDRVLHQPYSYHVMHNSSETVAALEKIQHLLAYVLVPLILGFTSFALAIFVFAAMIFLSPVIAIGGSVFFLALYGALTLLSRKRLHDNSHIVAESIRRRIQSVQEGLGGIRDIILDGSQNVFLRNFDRWESAFRQAQTESYFVSVAPRYAVETGIIILIALFALYTQSQPGGIAGAIPLLGAMAIGAQRLLPLGQQIYSSISQITASRRIIFDVADLLDQQTEPEVAASGPVAFERTIELRGVSFQYPAGASPALADLDLTIRKGDKLGLMGKSGSGKSTLADLLMGLLDPTAGEILVDDKPLRGGSRVAWRRRVAHVPQAIYLADTTIAGNIAFGRDPNDIDLDRVRTSARDADIDEFIMGLPSGYDTEVGERGVRLSGGQRQRLGIARALYKGAEVLILDEATSALDDATEASVMESIGRLSAELTVIIVAHRLSTLRGCDSVIELKNGAIVAQGSYAELVKNR